MQLAELTDVRSPESVPGVRRRPNLKALTSIRFFAALHVALYHLVRPFSLWGPLAGAMSVGYVGVSFFFVLSGFILTYSHAEEYESGRGSAKDFWVARLARIYPIYLLAMLFAGVVGFGQYHSRLHALAFGIDLALMQAWLVRAANFFNVPAWTISVEAFFYLVFPFVLLRLRPSSTRKAVAAAAGFWLLALAVPLLMLLRYPGATLTEDGVAGAAGSLLVFNARRIPLLMLPEFLFGISLGWLYLRFRPSRRMASGLLWVGGVATAAAIFFGNRLPFLLVHNGLLIPLFGMLLLGLCEPSRLSRLLSWTPLVLLGRRALPCI